MPQFSLLLTIATAFFLPSCKNNTNKSSTLEESFGVSFKSEFEAWAKKFVDNGARDYAPEEVSRLEAEAAKYKHYLEFFAEDGDFPEVKERYEKSSVLNSLEPIGDLYKILRRGVQENAGIPEDRSYGLIVHGGNLHESITEWRKIDDSQPSPASNLHIADCAGFEHFTYIKNYDVSWIGLDSNNSNNKFCNIWLEKFDSFVGKNPAVKDKLDRPTSNPAVKIKITVREVETASEFKLEGAVLDLDQMIDESRLTTFFQEKGVLLKPVFQLADIDFSDTRYWKKDYLKSYIAVKDNTPLGLRNFGMTATFTPRGHFNACEFKFTSGPGVYDVPLYQLEIDHYGSGSMRVKLKQWRLTTDSEVLKEATKNMAHQPLEVTLERRGNTLTLIAFGETHNIETRILVDRGYFVFDLNYCEKVSNMMIYDLN